MSAISLRGEHAEKPVIRALGMDDRVADIVASGIVATNGWFRRVAAAAKSNSGGKRYFANAAEGEAIFQKSASTVARCLTYAEC